MKTYRIIVAVSAIVILVSFSSCKDESLIEQPIVDKTEHFYLLKVDNYQLDEHKKRFNHADYPLEFKFMRRDSIFVGSVFFEKMGVKNIDTTGTDGTCFSVDINYKTVDALWVAFHSITVKGNNLECYMAFYSPTADYRTLRIIAVKR